MAEDKKQQYLESLDNAVSEDELAAAFFESETDIDDELIREKRLKNDDVEQNIQLKRKVLNRLFWFLGVETLFIFLFAFFQAVKWPFHFELKEWSFNILMTATILQIASMLLVAVRYLFPTAKENEHDKK
jgi:hypothetical protein